MEGKTGDSTTKASASTNKKNGEGKTYDKGKEREKTKHRKDKEKEKKTHDKGKEREETEHHKDKEREETTRHAIRVPLFTYEDTDRDRSRPLERRSDLFVSIQPSAVEMSAVCDRFAPLALIQLAELLFHFRDETVERAYAQSIAPASYWLLGPARCEPCCKGDMVVCCVSPGRVNCSRCTANRKGRACNVRLCWDPESAERDKTATAAGEATMRTTFTNFPISPLRLASQPILSKLLEHDGFVGALRRELERRMANAGGHIYDLTPNGDRLLVVNKKANFIASRYRPSEEQQNIIEMGTRPIIEGSEDEDEDEAGDDDKAREERGDDDDDEEITDTAHIEEDLDALWGRIGSDVGKLLTGFVKMVESVERNAKIVRKAKGREGRIKRLEADVVSIEKRLDRALREGGVLQTIDRQRRKRQHDDDDDDENSRKKGKKASPPSSKQTRTSTSSSSLLPFPSPPKRQPARDQIELETESSSDYEYELAETS